VKRLWVQQTLAFSIVVIIIMGAVAVWINRSTNVEFRKYITRRDFTTLGSGMLELLDFYQQGGAWEGVDGLLAEGVIFDRENGGISFGATSPESPNLDEKKRQPDVLLADGDGQIVFDSTGKGIGKKLDRTEQDYAWPIMEADDGSAIGYLLLFYPYTAPLDEQEQQFLDRLEFFATARHSPGRNLDCRCGRIPEPPPERTPTTPGGCGPGRCCRRPGAAG